MWVDRAVNVHALPSARLFERYHGVLGRPATGRPRRLSRMHGVAEHHRLVIQQVVQQVFVSRDECPLSVDVELTWNNLRLAILDSQPMQQRDQPGMAICLQQELK
jgi:hypothetical protein